MEGRYVFRLSQLLELRKRNLQDCQKLLAEAILRVQETEARLRALRGEQLALNELWRAAVRGAFRPDEGLNFEHALAALVRAEVRTMHDLIELCKARRECQLKLEIALAKCKALEKLRERGHARFVYEYNRREQAQMDEFAMLRQS
jgi:flagellar export protein FliJ